jgi:hypothetical protein
MFGEIIIIITGIFRWLFKGCRTKLSDEISGFKNKRNIRSENYIIGILIILSAILLCSRLKY